TAAEMFVARRSRTVGRATNAQGRGFLGAAIGALFGKALALSEEVHAAMIARGFQGEMRTLSVPRWRRCWRWEANMFPSSVDPPRAAQTAAKARWASPQEAAAPAFVLSGVCYAYGPGVVALRDVSLTIGQGEKVAILGANGCGKSTLIKLLGGLIHPQSGVITACGEPLTEVALRGEAFAYRFRRRVGFIFQNSDAQLFSPTVREEIAF